MPVASTPESRRAFAERMRRWRSRAASVLGPREDVLDLWSHLEPGWGRPRALRARQPLLVTTTPPSAHGVDPDPRVRPARVDELDLVLPASVHMFTAEIGYPPYTGSDRAYRSAVASLIARGRTYIVRDGSEVIFKTDVGSMAFGHAQLQGVWLAPRLRVAAVPPSRPSPDRHAAVRVGARHAPERVDCLRDLEDLAGLTTHEADTGGRQPEGREIDLAAERGARVRALGVRDHARLCVGRRQRERLRRSAIARRCLELDRDAQIGRASCRERV